MASAFSIDPCSFLNHIQNYICFIKFSKITYFSKQICFKIIQNYIFLKHKELIHIVLESYKITYFSNRIGLVQKQNRFRIIQNYIFLKHSQSFNIRIIQNYIFQTYHTFLIFCITLINVFLCFKSYKITYFSKQGRF